MAYYDAGSKFNMFKMVQRLTMPRPTEPQQSSAITGCSASACFISYNEIAIVDAICLSWTS